MGNTVKIKIEKKCDNFIEKSFGLMFHRKAKTTLFVNAKESKVIIHTFFLFFPIDVYWLDSNKLIISKEVLKPFSVSKSNNAKYLVETAKGLTEANIGDKFEFH